MILSSHGIIGSSIVQINTLLDLYPNAAAAYSLRLLRSAYTGSAIKVRRSVGSPSEKDIGFVNNELDVADLESFCSGTDGFVVTWYDQSGNANDATQATAANQPQIVSSGSVILENSKPAIDFDGSTFMPNGVGISTPSEISAFAVRSFSTYPSTYRTLFNYKVFGITYNSAGGAQYGVAHIFKTTSATAKSDNYPTTTGQAIDTIINQSNLERNLFSATLSVGSGYTSGTSTIGSFSSTSQTFIGNIQELIIYESNQLSNSVGIKTNINTFYSIY